MSTASVTATCPVCRQATPAGGETCPGCGAPPDWRDLIEANEFAGRRFEQWHQAGRLSAAQHQAVADSYRARRQELVEAARAGKPVLTEDRPAPRGRCWSCRVPVKEGEELCLGCGAPLTAPAVQSLRFFLFLLREIERQQAARRIALAEAHEFEAEVRERIAALRSRLEKDRVLTVKAAPQQPLPAAILIEEPAAPRRSLLEILLDPRSIQWLLAFGGALLVVGLVVWLATLGVFKQPGVIAGALGAGTAALLGGGWAMIKYTRYQTAGRALTLLACLVMPLNLWYYHASGLVTLEGHLWVPALACCVLYAASALVLRDSLFVYVLAGGVTLAGMLLLCDGNVARFWEIASPSTLLVVLGLLSLGAERAFPEGEGPFSRRRFGMAFFWSAQALLASGLLLLLGGQLFGWMHPALAGLFDLQRIPELASVPEIVSRHDLKVWALCLVLTGMAAYLYSDIVVRRVGVYVYLAVFALLWAEVLVVNLFPELNIALELVILVLAVTALAANLLQATLTRQAATFARSVPPLGLFLCTLPVLLGLILHLRAMNLDLNRMWPYVPGWGYVLAMLATAVSCRVGAYLYRHTIPWLSLTYFFGTAAATLVGAAGLLVVLGVRDWTVQADLLMLIPIAYLVAARLYRGHTPEKPLAWVAHTATAIMVLTVLGCTLDITRPVFEPVAGDRVNLLMALFFAEAAVFYGLATGFRRERFAVYLATATACGAVWQLLLYWHTPADYFTPTFALLGLGLLVLYRLAVLERLQTGGLASAAFRSANALMSLAFVSAALMTISRLLATLGHPLATPGTLQVDRGLLAVLLILTATSVAAAWLVKQQEWRRWYVVLAIVEGLLTFVTIQVLSTLTFWEKAELFSIAVGLLLLGVGHWGWYREQDRQNDMVSLSLFLGSLLAGLPLAISVLLHRYDHNFSPVNELGLLVVGVMLLGSGFIFRLRSTTLVGGGLLGVFLLSMVLFIRVPERLQTMALWMALGGGSIFVLGLLLSIYRDRLLALPDRIKRREGIFRVLTWR